MAQKFHGLALANNSTADNFHFERLALDPVVTKPGRMWFNTTDKVFKYSSLNGVGAVIINVIVDSSSLITLQASLATLQTNLNSEVTTRTSANTSILTELNAVETGAGLNADGTFTAPIGSNYISAALTLKAATVALDTVLKATETALTAEATTRATMDTAMQTQVDNLILASGDGSIVLKGTLNAGRYNVTTTVPALVHVITHNLNTSYYLSDIKVEGTDSIYRNDIVPVEVINMNSFKITLSEPLNVRVSVMSMAAIA